MNKEEFYTALKEAMDFANRTRFKEAVEKYLESNSIANTSKDLAIYFLEEYNVARADSLATYLEIAIKINPELALINKNENHFFRLIAIKGSKDLYDCYLEEAIIPYLKGKDEDFVADYFTELLITVSSLHDEFFPKYQPCVRGLHYSGVFGTADNNPNAYLINKEDYEVISETMEIYNTIIGRRDIIADLEERYEV
jgi:hypothetical protein